MTSKDPAAVSLGKRGGKAGTGRAKRRTREQYQAMAAKSAQVRKAKRAQKERT